MSSLSNAENGRANRRRRRFARPFVGAMVLFTAAAGSDFMPVLRAEDGDSLITPAGKKMRLLCIDAPEHKQHGGDEARAALQRLVNNGADVRRLAVDQYNRALVVVSVGDGGNRQIVNVEMLRRGWARVYWRYASACGIPVPMLRSAENDARRKKRGVWKYESSLPPWEWRKLFQEQE